MTPTLTPVDHDPFAAPAQSGVKLVPVDFDPFEQGKAQLKAKIEAGEKPNVDEVRRAASFPTVNKRPPAGMRDALASGATFGLSDEALAALESAKDTLVTGEPYSEAYANNLAAERERLDRYRKENPVKAGVGEVVGGLAAAPAKIAASAIEPAVSFGKSVLRGAKTGGAFGAVSGAGHAEGDLSDRAEGAKKGLALGAGIGAGVPVAFGAARVLAKPVTQPASGLVRPEGHAVDLLKRDLARDKVVPSEAITQLGEAAAAGKPMMIADLGGRNVMGLTRAVSTGKSAGSEQINAAMEARRLDSPGRIVEDIKAAIGNPDAFYPTLERIVARRKEIAAPLYEQAYAKALPETPAIKGVLETPAGQAAVKYAERLSANEGIPFEANSVRGVDLVKRAFDDGISQLRRSGQMNEARITGLLRDRMVRAVDTAVPEYALARKAYSSEVELEQALERGRSLLKTGQDHEAVIAELKIMSPAEKEVARLGMARQLAEMFDGTRRTASTINQLLTSDRMKQILGEIFPNKAAMDQFRGALMKEGLLLKRGQQVTGGSPTANKLADIEDAGMGEAALQAVSGHPLKAAASVASQLGDRVLKGLSEKTSNSLADILTTLDPAKQRAFLEAIEKQLPPGILSRLLTLAAPRVAVEAARSEQ